MERRYDLDLDFEVLSDLKVFVSSKSIRMLSGSCDVNINLLA